MPDLTILTPISLDHRALFAQAEASVLAQTVPVLHYAMLDTHSRGPGYIRNRLLEKVTTPYISFLDSDDWLEPQFAEIMLRFARPYRYLFSDWVQDGQPITAHAKPFCSGRFHLITAVYPTEVIRAVGGFDETLSGMEDTALALSVMARGVCGVRIPRALVHYRKGGGRSHALHQSGEIERLQAEINRRYGGIRMSCCGDKPTLPDIPLGTRQPGDVLAQALWGGNREEHGRATGRRYPRTSWPKQVWVDPRDVQAAPQHWQVVPEDTSGDEIDLDEEGADLRGVAALESQLMQAGIFKPAPKPIPGRPAPIAVDARPDFARVKALAEQALGNPEGATITPMEWDIETGDIKALVERNEQAIMDAFALPSDLVDHPLSKSVEPAIPITITPYAELPSVGVDNPIFVKPSRDYPSYSDFWKLVELAGYEASKLEYEYVNIRTFPSEIELHNPAKTYIFTGPEGIPDCSNAKARTIFWQLEYVGDYVSQANTNTVDEVWSSDPDHARRTGAKYVLLGSDRRLNRHWNKVKPKPQYDIVTLAYLTDRRRAIYSQLRDTYTFAPDYPGHDGDARHHILRRSRLMLHVHQHDTPAHTPLRYALAAAYRLPLISEQVPDMGAFYPTAIPFVDYDHIVSVVRTSWLEDGHLKPYGDSLYNLLCIEHPFEQCVREALNA